MVSLRQESSHHSLYYQCLEEDMTFSRCSMTAGEKVNK